MNEVVCVAVVAAGREVLLIGGERVCCMLEGGKDVLLKRGGRIYCWGKNTLFIGW